MTDVDLNLKYRYDEAEQYGLVAARRIPLSEYRPENAYEERAFGTASEFVQFGALMTVFVQLDSMLHELIETGESEDDFVKAKLRQMFLFLDEHPDAVKKWFYVDEFDAVASSGYGKTKIETGTRLICARLDPEQFECGICVMEDGQPCGMGLGVELRYRRDGRWSLFGYVPNDPDMPPGKYIIAANVKTTSWPCICGSRAVMNLHMMPLSASVETLRDINRQKTLA